MRGTKTCSAVALRTGAIALGVCVVVAGGAGAAGAAPGDSFTISGDTASSLYPGGSDAVDLALTNLTAGDLTVGEITVSIVGVTTQPERQCLLADFAVSQLANGLEFALPANATRTLRELGVAAADLPRVSMTNTPVNQDGCKNSIVNLAFAGGASEVGGVALPPAPTPTPTPATPDEPPAVGGVGLPDTGGSPVIFWIALGGLALVTAGGGSVLVARRTKGANR